MMIRSKVKSCICAFLLAVFMPGMGQWCSGRPRTAIAVYAWAVILYGLLWAGAYKRFAGLLAWLILLLIWACFNLGSAAISGIRSQCTERMSISTLAGLFGLGIGHLATVSFLVFQLGLPLKPYHVPTPSMSPALRVGDYFVIDRNIAPEYIKRGDIVVFTSPTHAQITYVKRVVGLPGEIIEIYGEKVWINGERLAEPYLPKASPSQPYFGGRHHGPLAVPTDSIYVLGDNRAHSADSRQFKSIKLSSVLGKTLYVLWPADLNRVGATSF